LVKESLIEIFNEAFVIAWFLAKRVSHAGMLAKVLVGVQNRCSNNSQRAKE
jgi:hypothetical protein